MNSLKSTIIKVLTFPLRIINLKFLNRYANFKNRLYSEVIKRSFKHCGINFYIAAPANIIGSSHITIGDNFEAYPRLRIEAYADVNGIKYSPEIVIGNNVCFNFDCHIGCVNSISIGNNVLIGSKVFITDHQHGESTFEGLQIEPRKRPVLSKGPVVVEDNVWIGEGVAIMPNVTIGNNSVVGANAVVTKSFPPYSVIAGVPARLIKSILTE